MSARLACVGAMVMAIVMGACLGLAGTVTEDADGGITMRSPDGVWIEADVEFAKLPDPFDQTAATDAAITWIETTRIDAGGIYQGEEVSPGHIAIYAEGPSAEGFKIAAVHIMADGTVAVAVYHGTGRDDPHRAVATAVLNSIRPR